MPIRGDRLRWPPRPGKRSNAAPSAARRALSGRELPPDVKQQLQEAKSDGEDRLGKKTSSAGELIESDAKDGEN
jgi:hypothetical protein